MTLLLDALLLGIGFSVLAGLALLGIAHLVLAMGQSLSVGLWRLARVLLLLPLIAGPVLSQIPRDVLMTRPDLSVVQHSEIEHAILPIGETAPASVVSGLEWSQTLMLALAGLYLAGLLTALLQAGLRHQRRARILAAAQPPSLLLRQTLESAARATGQATPVMLSSHAVRSPVLTGWRGVILAPPALEHEPQSARYALIHELVHLRRGDERDRLIGTALKTLFWFHWPLAQIEKQLDAAREIACDAEVMTFLGRGARKPYAASLISMMQAGLEPASAFGADNRRHREMRIKAIMSGRSFSSRASVLFLGLAVLVLSPVAFAQTVLTERAETLIPVYLPAIAEAPTAPARQDMLPAPAPQPTPAIAVAALPAPAPQATPAQSALGEPSPAPDPFRHAVAEGRITSLYGDRPSRPLGAPRFHHGVDIAGPIDSDIYAAADGVVVHAENGYNGHDAWGLTVVIDHGDGWETLYAHMHSFDVAVGDRVTGGERIGGMGTTGLSTGSHLHVEVRRDGERLDPSEYLPGLLAANR